jgi:hypothetical protein
MYATSRRLALVLKAAPLHAPTDLLEHCRRLLQLPFQLSSEAVNAWQLGVPEAYPWYLCRMALGVEAG